jgi:PRTRC genetic system protein B
MTNQKTIKKPKLVREKWAARISLYRDHAYVEMDHPEGLLEKQVALDSLGPVFANVPVGTGLLPRNILFYEKQNGEQRIGIYIEPDRYTFRTPDREYKLPMPGFVFVGQAQRYSLYAVAETDWPGQRTRLYWPPMTNIMGGGFMCTGTVKVPSCAPDTIWGAWAALMSAYFTPHAIEHRSKSHTSVIEFWEFLETVDAFPYDELVPMDKPRTLEELLKGG